MSAQQAAQARSQRRQFHRLAEDGTVGELGRQVRAAVAGHEQERHPALGQGARDRGDGTSLIRIGFTATRRIGGAVTRNRAKRRLREAARLLAPLHARPGCDYVFIARQGTVTRPWARLLDDMRTTLQRLAADL